jgi:hypothetical protein
MGKPLHLPTQADRGSLYTTVKSTYVVHDNGVAPHCTITLKTFLKNDNHPEQEVNQSALNARLTISTDLNLAGFHFWSRLKNMIDVITVKDVEEL